MGTPKGVRMSHLHAFRQYRPIDMRPSDIALEQTGMRELPLPKGVCPERAGVPFSILIRTLRRLKRIVAPVEKREHR